LPQKCTIVAQHHRQAVIQSPSGIRYYCALCSAASGQWPERHDRFCL